MSRVYVYCYVGDHVVNKEDTAHFAGSENGFICKECYVKKEKDKTRKKRSN